MPRDDLHRRGLGRITAGALLVCGLATACTGAQRGEPGPHRQPADDRAPAWTTQPPAGCGLGASGPTLDPGDALRRARLRALEQLAAAELGVRIDSELYIGTRGTVEITEHAIDGVLASSRIVAMTAVGREAAPGRMGEVLALACREGAEPAGLDARPHPAWILDPPDAPGRLCAIGVGGPTWAPGDQPAAALRDGRQALALAIEARIQRRSLDTGHGRLRVASASSPTARARARADAVDALDARWRDETGGGPLALPGVLYGLVCADPGH